MVSVVLPSEIELPEAKSAEPNWGGFTGSGSETLPKTFTVVAPPASRVNANVEASFALIDLTYDEPVEPMRL